jgi:hypothetical protein
MLMVDRVVSAGTRDLADISIIQLIFPVLDGQRPQRPTRSRFDIYFRSMTSSSEVSLPYMNLPEAVQTVLSLVPHILRNILPIVCVLKLSNGSIS